MKNSNHRSLVAEIATSLRNNRPVEALSDLNAPAMTYSALAAEIARIHQLLIAAGIRPGDKIALCGKNSARWAVTFIAGLTYGAVTVPLLHEFRPEALHHLINHSDARLLFIDRTIMAQLSFDDMKALDGVFDLETGALTQCRSKALQKGVDSIDTLIKQAYPRGIDGSNFDKTYFHDMPDDTAVINYTSGSTGMSKGVVLSYGNLWSNARFATDNIDFYEPGDPMVSMLPLAHMFGMLVELIFPLLKGCHIIFLGKVPSPKILLDAFAKYRPKMVVTVPLVIEKIVRNKVLPSLDRQPVKTLLRVPLLRRVVYRAVRRKMIDAFGGRLLQLIIGGAALSRDIENLLLKIRFPYTVGYGMTECGPLIAYCRWDRQKAGSCGRIVDRMQARIDSPDPASTPGVLWVKGDNVMKGYYKNQEASEGVFSDDGWMNTGDICVLDSDGYLFIRGRDKTMILGPSGQNIYPEEIENKLNHMPLVAESLVVERDGRLVALVYPDFEAARQAHIAKERLPELIGMNLNKLNSQLAAYEKVAEIELRDEPFDKTPKQSIRRYLYK